MQTRIVITVAHVDGEPLTYRDMDRALKNIGSSTAPPGSKEGDEQICDDKTICNGKFGRGAGAIEFSYTIKAVAPSKEVLLFYRDKPESKAKKGSPR